MGYDGSDEEGSRRRIIDLLARHDATKIARCVKTVHGPTYYFDKAGMEDLKRVEEINRERREILEERRRVNQLVDELLSRGNVPVAGDGDRDNTRINVPVTPERDRIKVRDL
jgi:hypothetical protein